MWLRNTLCADVICSKGKETSIAPSIHKAFPTISISLRHSTTLQDFHLKRPTFLKILGTKHPKGAFWENEENAMMPSMAAARLASLPFVRRRKSKEISNRGQM